MQQNYLFKDTDVREPSVEERQNITKTLWLEYRGAGTTIDNSNISDVAKGLNKTRLSQFALYINVIKPIIDKENSTYVNPPTRKFTTKTGRDIPTRLQDTIIELLDSMQYDVLFQTFEAQAALLGTVLVRPSYNPVDNTFSLISLLPSNKTLKVTPDPFISSKPLVVKYKASDKVKLIYDTINVTTITTNEQGQETTTIEPHGFNGQPFVSLNFTPDNSVFWGPYDGTLYSFTKQRSLVLANSMAASHLSEAERLVMTGVTWEEALTAIRERLIVLPNDKIDKAGNKIDQNAQILSPDGKEALTLLETYLKIYRHLLDVRGHAQKQFSVGADAMSAEAVRLGGVDMSQQVQRKRAVLSNFEQEMWQRVIWINNKVEGNFQIPTDTKLVVDWKPDAMHFSSASDETTFFNNAITKNVMTPIDWIRSRQPELSEKEAIKRFEDNKVFNQEQSQGINIIDTVMNTTNQMNNQPNNQPSTNIQSQN